MRHVNIPIFIPHLGCPNQCVFCNQRFISGRTEFRPSEVEHEIEQALSTVSPDDEVEIAFFGGSFTGIDRDLMIGLLKLAYSYVLKGRVRSVRCSTRPDYIDGEILSILARYGVKTIELGLQSVCDEVLCATKRGHTSADEESACKLIVERGFELVGQMMIGLPGADLQSEILTAKRIVSFGASAVRVYPTVVFNQTELKDMCLSGEYTPLTLEDAVCRSASVLRIFIESSVKVIRIGLCASDNLTSEDSFFAGPNHPALGELIEGRVYFDKLCEIIGASDVCGKVLSIFVPRGELSKVIGQKRVYKEKIVDRYAPSSIKYYEDAALSKYDMTVDIT